MDAFQQVNPETFNNLQTTIVNVANKAYDASILLDEEWDRSKSQIAFNNSLNDYLQGLEQIYNLAIPLGDGAVVSSTAISKIDDGINPLTETRDFIEKNRLHNDLGRGFMASAGIMRESIQQQIGAWEHEQQTRANKYQTGNLPEANVSESGVVDSSTKATNNTN